MRSNMALTAAAIMMCSAIGARAATDMEKFQGRVQKYAAPTFDIFDKPKGLCACINDPGNADNNGMAGVLDSALVSVPDVVPQRIRVRCMVMKATNAGNITQAESCEDFVPLAK